MILKAIRLKAKLLRIRTNKEAEMQNGTQRGLRLGTLTVVTLCFWASSLTAQSPVGPKFLVNPPSSGAQDSPDLQFDNSGRLWITWLDTLGPDAAFDRVMARAVLPHGDLGPSLTLLDTSDVPFTPAIEPLILPSHEGFDLIYTRQTGQGFGHAYDQQFDDSGKPQGGRVVLTPPAPASAIGVAVAAFPTEGFVLMTTGTPCLTCPGPAQGSLFARIFAPDVSTVRQYFRVPRKSEMAVQGVRSIAVSGEGDITAVWGGVDDLAARDGSDIHGRRFSSLGEPVDTEFVVNTTLRGTQSAPSVAADAAGDFVVVWQARFPNSLLRSIFGQRFSKTGKKVGPEFRVNEDRVEKDFAPSVAMDHDGNFVVAWESFSQARPDCTQVRARLYRRDGKPAGPEFPVAPGDAACGELPKVAFGPNGIFAIAWEVELGFSPDTGSDFDVYAARFSVSPALP